jgi:hypothetical protein
MSGPDAEADGTLLPVAATDATAAAGVLLLPQPAAANATPNIKTPIVPTSRSRLFALILRPALSTSSSCR